MANNNILMLKVVAKLYWPAKQNRYVKLVAKELGK